MDSPPSTEPSSEPADLGALLDAQTALQTGKLLLGPTGWLFLPAEDRLRHARSIALPAGSGYNESNPHAAILEFATQLRARGIVLLFVPVPAKLSVYPEMLTGGPLASAIKRPDQLVSQLLDELAIDGVRTLDLYPAFHEERAKELDLLYLATDSHWSPRGAMIAARRVAEELRSLGLAPPPPSTCDIRVTVERHGVRGDLVSLAPTGTTIPTEIVSFYRANRVESAQREPDRTAILVLGDSHLAIWRTRASGFVDHLQAELCREVDELSVQAGGATASRQSLVRRPRLLDGKRVVVWTLASRSLVSGPPWLPVPLPTK